MADKAAHHVPPGLPNLIPQLVAADADGLLQFLERGFGAERRNVMPGPDGKGIMHGHVAIGGTVLFVAGAFGPAQPTASNLFLYVPDCDAAVRRAADAGAKVLSEPADMFWGDRWALLADPFGNLWQIATHKETLGPDEMMKRMAKRA